MPRQQALAAFNVYVSQAFLLEGGARTMALERNARLATEIRRLARARSTADIWGER